MYKKRFDKIHMHLLFDKNILQKSHIAKFTKTMSCRITKLSQAHNRNAT